MGAELVPVSGPEVDALIAKYGFFAKDKIPAGTYEGIDSDTPTISVGAQWVVGAEVDEELVYEITKAVWNKNTRQLLDKGHARGKAIQSDGARRGRDSAASGAERYYREAGLLK